MVTCLDRYSLTVSTAHLNLANADCWIVQEAVVQELNHEALVSGTVVTTLQVAGTCLLY